MTLDLITQADSTTALGPAGRYVPSVDASIGMWLQSVATKGSNSPETRRKYLEVITAYRAALQSAGLDLDDEAHPAEMAQMASVYAATNVRQPDQMTGKATRAQRLAIAASYFAFLVKRGYRERNPMDMIDRPTAQAYAHAAPLAQVDLSPIDRATLAGKRTMPS